MTVKQFFKAFFLSAYGAVTLALSLFAGLVTGRYSSWYWGIATALLFFLLSVLFGFITKIGIKSALKTFNDDSWQEINKKLQELERTVRTIKVMRLNDEKLSKISAQIAFRAEKYIAVCRKFKTHDPKVSYEIEQVPELIDALLNEIDETAVEARFKLEDQHEFPFARDRVIAELERISRMIEHASLTIAHELLPAEKLEQKELL